MAVFRAGIIEQEIDQRLAPRNGLRLSGKQIVMLAKELPLGCRIGGGLDKLVNTFQRGKGVAVPCDGCEDRIDTSHGIGGGGNRGQVGYQPGDENAARCRMADTPTNEASPAWKVASQEIWKQARKAGLPRAHGAVT